LFLQPVLRDDSSGLIFPEAASGIAEEHCRIEIQNPHLHSYRRGLVSDSAAVSGDQFAWNGP
jgi:hypothetical protein